MPRRSRPRSFSAALVVAALLAACTTGTADEEPTSTPSTETTTTTAPSSPDTASPTPSATATPTTEGAEAMTVARAQQIVDATTAVYNDAVTRMLTQQRIGQRWYDQMRTIYEDPMVELVEALWIQAGSREFDGYNLKDPSGLEDTVLEIVATEPDCFVVRIERNFYGLTKEGSDSASPPSDRYFLAFQRAPDGADRDGAGTGWLRSWDAQFRDETPTDLCSRPNPGLGEGEGS